MGVILNKIWRDLWTQRGRTLQVVLIIAVGAFAIGMIITTRNLVIAGMQDIWQGSSPATISLWLSPAVDGDTLLALERIEGLDRVEGIASTSVEWRHHPDEPWRPAGLSTREDYPRQRYTRLELVSGAWPADRTMAIGQGGDSVFGIAEGSQVYLRVDDHEHRVTIGGVVYDPVVPPPNFGGTAQFYAHRDRFGELTGNRNFGQLLAGTSGPYHEATALHIADQMQDKLERQGIDSGGATPPQGTRVAAPDKHFFQDAMDAIFLVLGVLAALALILGLFLVYNTINAVVSQQIRQIGIMKAIGARTRQVLRIYLLTVLAYGAMALVIALPTGVLSGWFLSAYLVSSFNADPGAFQISRAALWAMIAISLIAPLLASLFPILTGARITVNQAINTYGLSAPEHPARKVAVQRQAYLAAAAAHHQQHLPAQGSGHPDPDHASPERPHLHDGHECPRRHRLHLRRRPVLDPEVRRQLHLRPTRADRLHRSAGAGPPRGERRRDVGLAERHRPTPRPRGVR